MSDVKGLETGFYLVMAAVLDLYLEWAIFTDRLVKNQKERWAKLTRPLKPSTKEAFARQVAEEQRTLHAFRNQDIKNYTADSWWSEYYQAKAANVN